METEVKMNEQTLNYHKKVQDWSQIYHLTDEGKIYKASRVRYLPLHKVQQIESWRKDVSKTSKGSKINRKARSAAKESSKTKTDVWTLSDFYDRPKSTGIINGTSANQNKNGQWLHGQVINGKLNFEKAISSLNNNLAETTLHYAAQRRGVYTTNIAQDDSIKIDNKQVPGTEKINSQQVSGNVDDENIIPESTNPTDPNDKQNLTNDHTLGKNKVDKIDSDRGTDVSSVGTPSEGELIKMASRGNTIYLKDKLTPKSEQPNQNKERPMVAFRSCSNNILNVVSMDDVKMAYYLRKRQTSNVTSKDSVPNKVNGDVNNSLDNSEKTSKTETGSSNNSRTVRKTTLNRTTKINNAIDGIVAERKVMNSMDKNFDTRIGSKSRTHIQKFEGGPTFRRLNKSLRRHIENIAFNQYPNGSLLHYPHQQNGHGPHHMPFPHNEGSQDGDYDPIKEENELDDEIHQINTESEFGQCESETLAGSVSSFRTHDMSRVDRENTSYAMETPAIREELEDSDIDRSVT